jgi:large subunit ribosomal protein L1
MRKFGKKYVEASKLVEANKAYSLTEAVELVKKTSVTKFDSSVEVAVKLNIDTKKADQQLRGSLVLPNGNGKTKRILVLAKGSAAEAAKKAGADFVGEQDLIDKIAKENWFEYDVIIATPDMMPLLGRIGKVLGPRGLMPNPKTGTVTADPAKAVEDVKRGMIEYRADQYGNVHAMVGKVSFDDKKLVENITYVVSQIVKVKPQTVKGKYIQNISLSSTMGPGIHVELNSIDM